MKMRHWPAGCAVVILLLLVLSATTFAQAPAAQGTTRARVVAAPHVYLMRGLLNMFSLGMDRLGEKIERHGIPTTVANQLAWDELADEAIANCKSGRLGAIMLIGHSAGAISAIKMANRLNQAGVIVALVVTFDPVLSSPPVTANVRKLVNFYFSNGVGTTVPPGTMFHGSLINVDLKARNDLGHISLGQADDIHDQVLRYVLAARNGSCHR
jgi:hypothetical protein